MIQLRPEDWFLLRSGVFTGEIYTADDATLSTRAACQRLADIGYIAFVERNEHIEIYRPTLKGIAAIGRTIN